MCSVANSRLKFFLLSLLSLYVVFVIIVIIIIVINTNVIIIIITTGDAFPPAFSAKVFRGSGLWCEIRSHFWLQREVADALLNPSFMAVDVWVQAQGGGEGEVRSRGFWVRVE